MADTPKEMVAQATQISEAVVNLIQHQTVKEHNWTPEKTQTLKVYIRKKLVPEDIAIMMGMPLDSVKKQSEKIMNSKKKPIRGSMLYRSATEDHHATYIPPFIKATISINRKDQPVKQLDQDERGYELYAGACSCKEKNQHRKTFIVLGQSGAGKTTFVDSFCNHVLGIEIQDKFRYKLVDEKQIEEERARTQEEAGNEVTKGTMSMTSTVTIYHIPAKHIVNKISEEDCCINIIDTPGFGDTRGQAWDLRIFNMISNLLNSIESLNYLLMVVKATENRLSSSTKFVYKKIQKLYQDDEELANRMLGIFTFSDASEPQGYTAVAASGIQLA